MGDFPIQRADPRLPPRAFMTGEDGYGYEPPIAPEAQTSQDLSSRTMFYGSALSPQPPQQPSVMQQHQFPVRNHLQEATALMLCPEQTAMRLWQEQAAGSVPPWLPPQQEGHGSGVPPWLPPQQEGHGSGVPPWLPPQQQGHGSGVPWPSQMLAARQLALHAAAGNYPVQQEAATSVCAGAMNVTPTHQSPAGGPGQQLPPQGWPSMQQFQPSSAPQVNANSMAPPPHHHVWQPGMSNTPLPLPETSMSPGFPPPGSMPPAPPHQHQQPWHTTVDASKDRGIISPPHPPRPSQQRSPGSMPLPPSPNSTTTTTTTTTTSSSRRSSRSSMPPPSWTSRPSRSFDSSHHPPQRENRLDRAAARDNQPRPSQASHLGSSHADRTMTMTTPTPQRPTTDPDHTNKTTKSHPSPPNKPQVTTLSAMSSVSAVDTARNSSSQQTSGSAVPQQQQTLPEVTCSPDHPRPRRPTEHVLPTDPKNGESLPPDVAGLLPLRAGYQFEPLKPGTHHLPTLPSASAPSHSVQVSSRDGQSAPPKVSHPLQVDDRIRLHAASLLSHRSQQSGDRSQKQTLRPTSLQQMQASIRERRTSSHKSHQQQKPQPADGQPRRTSPLKFRKLLNSGGRNQQPSPAGSDASVQSGGQRPLLTVSHPLQSAGQPQQALPAASHPLQSAGQPQQAIPAVSHPLQSVGQPQQAIPAASHPLQSADQPQQALPAVSHPLQSADQPQQAIPAVSHPLQSVGQPQQALPVASHPLQSVGQPQQALPAVSHHPLRPTSHQIQLPSTLFSESMQIESLARRTPPTVSFPMHFGSQPQQTPQFSAAVQAAAIQAAAGSQHQQPSPATVFDPMLIDDDLTQLSPLYGFPLQAESQVQQPDPLSSLFELPQEEANGPENDQGFTYDQNILALLDVPEIGPWDFDFNNPFNYLLQANNVSDNETPVDKTSSDNQDQ